MTRVGFVDSGLGLTGYADALARALPGAELVLAMDPDHSPYGALSSARIVERTLASVRAALDEGAQAIVIACNTASVHALDAVRAAVDVPVIGTVPAVRSASRLRGPFAVWATEATTGSPYQQRLIAQFAADLPVTEVACPGLASAIDAADEAGIAAAVNAAAGRTPADARAVVLGCTHYGLVADRIAATLPPGTAVLDSPEPVARQTVRRLAAEGIIGEREAAAALARLIPAGNNAPGADALSPDAPGPGTLSTDAPRPAPSIDPPGSDASRPEALDAGIPADRAPAGTTVPSAGTNATTPPERTACTGTTGVARVIAVLHSGRPGPLPAALHAFPAGRRLLA